MLDPLDRNPKANGDRDSRAISWKQLTLAEAIAQSVSSPDCQSPIPQRRSS